MHRILFLLLCFVLTDVKASHDNPDEQPPARVRALRAVEDARTFTAAFLDSFVRLTRHPLDSFRDLGRSVIHGLDNLERVMRIPPRPIVIREPGGWLHHLRSADERRDPGALPWVDAEDDLPVVVIRHTPLEHARCDLDIWLRENRHHLDEDKQRDVRSLWHLTAPDVFVTLENLDEGLAYLRRIGDSSPCYRLCVETAYHWAMEAARVEAVDPEYPN